MTRIALTIFFIYLLLGSNAAMAIDSGNLYRLVPDKRLHTSLILEEEIRTLNVNSVGILDRIGQFFVDPENPFTETELIGKITSYNLLFRTTLYLGNDLSIFGDVGLYNDVDSVIQAPPIVGGGARISQEVYPDTFISVYGKGHVTTKYRYKMIFDLGEQFGDYQAAFDGRFYTATAGVMFTNHIALETIDIYPYIGGEASFIRGSSEVSDFRIPGSDKSLFNSVNQGLLSSSVSQENLFLMVLGITLKRHNNATIRVETKVSRGEGTLGIEFGLFL